MENRLQPGLGSTAPRFALFALLAALSIVLIGIYWFNQRDTISPQEQAGIEKLPVRVSSSRFAFRREAMTTASVTDSQVVPVSPRLPAPPRRIAKNSPPLPIPPPFSQSVMDAMAQNDPEDPQEQGDDIAVLKDEKAAHPKSVGPAIALSRRLMQAGRYIEAAQELRQVLQQAPTHYGARHQLGSALAAQGQKEEAIREWRALVQTGDPTWSSIAQGAISRITHPETPDIAVAETPIPDMRPARPIVSLE